MNSDASQKVVSQTKKISKESLDELQESYNKVLSKTLNGLYTGVRYKGSKFTYVYVNSNWYALNKGQKEVVVARVVKTYLGMHGARVLPKLKFE